MTDAPIKPFFIYTTRGDWMATLIGTQIFDTRGEYVGYIAGPERSVYTRDGEWVGDMSKDGRILRKRAAQRRPLQEKLPPKPAGKPSNLPPRAPLPPQMAELRYDTIDVLEEEEDIFKRLSDRRKDLGE
ncbi:MAG: hypothetical protein KF716_06150 [Anaerolineae bacterium]|nr:hypothetical protein [Anaerolineae bacterium]